ncbi:MAG TPA: response regulator [Candidatus Limnocylindria bacterium]
MTEIAAKRVLVVDDDPETRSWMSGYLADLGYEPHLALDADHALRSAIALRPEFILLDVYLPTPAFALQFAARYRDRVPADRRAPIIAMSASNELPRLAQQIGASDTLAKPFELSALAKLLGKYLDEPAPVPLVEAPEQVPAEATDLAPQPETGPA